MTIDIVIPVRNGARTLAAALDAVAALDVDEPPVVIVVDDGSRDGSAEIASAHPLRPLLVAGPQTGAGAARNAGVRTGHGTVIAFTDADCQPEPGWLREGLRALAESELVQGAVLPVAGARVGPWDRTLTVIEGYGLFEAANLFVRREVFEGLGGFRETADSGARTGGRPFGEDTEFGWRARRAGVRNAFEARAVVRHAVFAGRPADLLRERRRDGLFCDLVRRVPELRDAFLYRRWFLNERTARFDLMALGVVGACARRRIWPLLLAVPYAQTVSNDGRRVRHVLVLADIVGGWALLRATVRTRSPVL